MWGLLAALVVAVALGYWLFGEKNYESEVWRFISKISSYIFCMDLYSIYI